MRAEAVALRDAAERGQLLSLTTPVEEEDVAAREGRLLVRRHVARERDPRLRRRKIEAALRSGRDLACEACGFDFGQTYGERGRGYIECHHVIPLHAIGERTTRLDDLALLCANCHRMVHARAPWPTPAELSALMMYVANH